VTTNTNNKYVGAALQHPSPSPVRVEAGVCYSSTDKWNSMYVKTIENRSNMCIKHENNSITLGLLSRTPSKTKASKANIYQSNINSNVCAAGSRYVYDWVMLCTNSITCVLFGINILRGNSNSNLFKSTVQKSVVLWLSEKLKSKWRLRYRSNHMRSMHTIAGPTHTYTILSSTVYH